MEVIGNISASEKVLASVFASHSPLIFEAPVGTERARIDDITGNFGIGTTSPAYTLDVQGDVQAYSYHTGDIYFQKDGRELWRMFEDEDGLYLESLEHGTVYQIMMKQVNK